MVQKNELNSWNLKKMNLTHGIYSIGFFFKGGCVYMNPSNQPIKIEIIKAPHSRKGNFEVTTENDHFIIHLNLLYSIVTWFPKGIVSIEIRNGVIEHTEIQHFG